MKLLSGTELVGYIKERQARQVRALRQAEQISPRLAIIQTSASQVIDTYVRMKRRYGEDILVEVDIYKPPNEELFETIKKCNQDDSVHGMIVQLPLEDKNQTDQALQLVAPEKDVDGLGGNDGFTPATAMAIDWLLAGYNVGLSGKNVAIVGYGRLVGEPLAKLWRAAGYEINVYTRSTENMPEKLKEADVIVTATGVPNLIRPDMVKPGAVIVDAATAAEKGKIVGDVSPKVRERDDITITPEKGGVGPLTVAALFDNVIRAARRKAETKI